MTRLLLALVLLFVSVHSYSAQTVKLNDSFFEVKRPHALNALDSAVDDMPGFLKNFKPKGAQVSNLRITDETLEFTITKTILFITRSARVNAKVGIAKQNKLCPSGSSAGFIVDFDLRDSEEVVIENVDTIRMEFCASEPILDTLKIITKGYLIQGPNYDSLIGGMITAEIGAQIPALIQAFKTHILNQK